MRRIAECIVSLDAKGCIGRRRRIDRLNALGFGDFGEANRFGLRLGFAECNLLFGLGAKQHGFFFGFRFLDYRNAIRLGIEFCRRTRRLGVEDLDFFVLLSIENGRFFRRLRHRQLFTAFAFGFHLAFHRILNIARWLERLDLDARNLDTPLISRFIQFARHLSADFCTTLEALFEVEFTNDAAQRRDRQRTQALAQIAATIRRQFRIENRIKYERIGANRNRILRNDIHRRNVISQFRQRHLRPYPIEERNQKVHTAVKLTRELSQTLDNVDLRLRNDADRLRQNDHDDDQKHYNADQ